MNYYPSEHAYSVDLVMLFIVGVSVVLLLGITAAMIFFVIKYNRKRNPVASQIEGHTVLEIVWVVVPVLLVLVMFYFGYAVFHEGRIVPKDALVVKATGRMWQWQFTYPNGKKADTMYLPINKPVKVELKSLDVNHSLFIPAFRIKEDVVPNHDNYLVITPKMLGSYDIECSQYCGMNHSLMLTKVIVLPQDEYNRWVESINN